MVDGVRFATYMTDQSVMVRISDEARADTRRRLLEAAARHLAGHGLAGANVDAIATAAGVAKGTFYNYFDTKEHVFFEVIAEAARRAAERYAQVVDTGSTRERLVALAAADVSVLREEEDFTKVVVREAMSFRQETYPAIIRHLAPWIGRVEAVIAEGVAAGDIRGDRPTIQLALMFVGMLTLLYVQHWGSDGAWPTLDEIPELATSSFLEGAQAR